MLQQNLTKVPHISPISSSEKWTVGEKGKVLVSSAVPIFCLISLNNQCLPISTDSRFAV